MTCHSEIIAAILAAQTPIGTQYRLVDVPGTELTDANPVRLAFLAAERELGERIGYPALVYHPTTKRTPRYYFEPSRDGGSDIIDEDRPIRDTDIVDRMNEQDDDIQSYKAQLAQLRISCAAHQKAENEMIATIAALRADLDDAHQHVGALVAACDEAHQVLWHYDLVRQPNGVDWEPVEELQSRLIAQLGASHDAARAWLRRRG